MRLAVHLNIGDIKAAIVEYVERNHKNAKASDVEIRIEEQGEPIGEECLLGATAMIEVVSAAKPEKKK